MLFNYIWFSVNRVTYKHSNKGFVMCLKNLLVAFREDAYCQIITNNLSTKIKSQEKNLKNKKNLNLRWADYLGTINVHSNIKPVGFKYWKTSSKY